MNIDGSVALITGGASGLGRGAAEALLHKGGRVAILDLPTSPGREVADALGEAADFVPADVRDTDQVAGAIQATIESHGRIDLVLNAAGVVTAHRVVTRDGKLFPLDLFRFSIDVNLIGQAHGVNRLHQRT